MSLSEINSFYPENPQQWRKWLEENHKTEQSIWLIYYKKGTGIASLSWSEAVDEALCFGWIDSTKKTIDDERYIQLFSKRKPTSMWSKINKEKVKLLTKEKRMMASGMASIAIAKENGSWFILDEVEELNIPDDLEQALSRKTGSKEFYLSLSVSIQKNILVSLVLAKRPETRAKRLEKIIDQIEAGSKPIVL